MSIQELTDDTEALKINEERERQLKAQAASDSDSSDDEQLPTTTGKSGIVKVPTRGEAKAKKALLKLGLKPIPGISRVTLKKARGAKPEDVNAMQNSMQALQQPSEGMPSDAATRAQMAALGNLGRAQQASGGGARSATADAPAEEEGEVDETGVEAKDVELVMQQVGCSRAKAVRALKENNNDLVTDQCHHGCELIAPSMTRPNVFSQILRGLVRQRTLERVKTAQCCPVDENARWCMHAIAKQTHETKTEAECQS
ncbi:uncharacterized protein L969DRAFT_318473 [Mixia osmundae IAM 14324]|uniref:uncharacterized protein n=1 Tax=Mixia osmundae (strain CBS 9802 / IAM 14324 / JCM 22182 / KY 12970) TaxID=764103 RepID=UPI0004A54D80|nr:uncharacterized protein L969DRAFT_318473 [Mixia osmundae IAM 14324]KEI41604.1 hypothetical protein L969DRAFT_318473 [Mixia osmundae IAM 14324]